MELRINMSDMKINIIEHIKKLRTIFILWTMVYGLDELLAFSKYGYKNKN